MQGVGQFPQRDAIARIRFRLSTPQGLLAAAQAVADYFAGT
jgi:hypothetical protein